jgi:two-component system chemotaxis response regulator CheB
VPNNWKVVVIGASAGGVEALMNVVSALPRDLDAPVFVCLHISAGARSALPQILSRLNSLPAAYPADGQRIQPGRIYVAPPDHHMLLRDGKIELSKGPKENAARPAIDPLFRTAAVSYGERAVGVLLSGTLDDGSYGLKSIHRAGGKVIVQDPEDAMFPDMPNAAIRLLTPDFTAASADIGAIITELVLSPNGKHIGAVSKADVEESNIAELRGTPTSTIELGQPSMFGCPLCSGVLWELKHDGDPRYRCRVGHSYTADALLESQVSVIEGALWSAVRALQERADLLTRISRRMAGTSSQGRFEHSAQEASAQAQSIIDLLSKQERPIPSDEIDIGGEIKEASAKRREAG